MKTLTGQRPIVSTLVFADGGKTLVLAGAGMVIWWDTGTGKEQRSWKPFADEQQPVKGGGMKTKTFDTCALSPDARSIAVRVAWNYDQAAQARRQYVEAEEHEALGLELGTGKTLWRVTGRYNIQHNSYFAFSAESPPVAHSIGPNRLEVRSAVTGKLVATPLERMVDGIYTRVSVALSGDARTVACAGDNSRVLVGGPDTAPK